RILSSRALAAVALRAPRHRRRAQEAHHLRDRSYSAAQGHHPRDADLARHLPRTCRMMSRARWASGLDKLLVDNERPVGDASRYIENRLALMQYAEARREGLRQRRGYAQEPPRAADEAPRGALKAQDGRGDPPPACARAE